MIKNSSLIGNLLVSYEYHSKFPVHIFTDCMASLSWTEIMKGKRSHNSDQKSLGNPKVNNSPTLCHYDIMQFNKSRYCRELVSTTFILETKWIYRRLFEQNWIERWMSAVLLKFNTNWKLQNFAKMQGFQIQFLRVSFLSFTSWPSLAVHW